MSKKITINYKDLEGIEDIVSADEVLIVARRGCHVSTYSGKWLQQVQKPKAASNSTKSRPTRDTVASFLQVWDELE